MQAIEDTQLRAFIEAAQDKKAQDIVVFAIDKLSIMADYVMLASGTSTTHAGAVAQGIVSKAKEMGAPVRSEGLNDKKWVLIDLGTVIVHVMTEEIRKFYALEELWALANVVYRGETTELSPVD
ncbi:MAG: ribosome silencing factor [Candidatus Sericytochromatia bacterium]|nr:ribosome silencing factor [Candidatus Sericytochromatia bacterium]